MTTYLVTLVFGLILALTGQSGGFADRADTLANHNTIEAQG